MLKNSNDLKFIYDNITDSSLTIFRVGRIAEKFKNWNQMQVIAEICKAMSYQLDALAESIEDEYNSESGE